ncbi:thymidylate synthase [Bacillus cereus group sp. TH152-1LC]|uniref:thymidylate synthase n=1 Tax=Bacillus cereus group sp. TH152-1LC TaxID=3018060 RepID=UPI0022E471BB|nr:thymidylate synthase [Bacillus cereus group sp. TH152-1LC]MDA1674877.1 thymidylate synthase [Bacillus cereus group sp. TH152-1LC]
MSQHQEYQYLNLMKDILENGIRKDDRTGTGTISVFGRQIRFDLSKGFPLLTTKRVSMKLIASELLWFIKGDTNIRYLLQHNNHIWDEWAFKQWVESDEYTGPDMTDFGKRATVDPEFNEVYQEELKQFCNRILEDDEFATKYGSIGEGAYGAQWRSYSGPNGKKVDQLKQVIETLKTNPDSRRMLVNAWNAATVDLALLPPCHYAFQFYVAEGKLSCMFSMRSNDIFLGLPFNIASYALLTHMIAQECGLEVGELVYTGADVHIYSNHIEQVHTQLEREPKEFSKLVLNPEKKSIFDFEMEDIQIEGYDPHPTIKAPVAV